MPIMLWTHVAVCRGRHADSPARTQAEAARLFKQVKDAYEVLSDGAPLNLWTMTLLRGCSQQLPISPLHLRQ